MQHCFQWREQRKELQDGQPGYSFIHILGMQLTAISNERVHFQTLQWNVHVMDQQVFAFSLITEGTTEKLLQFTVPLKSIYNKTLI